MAEVEGTKTLRDTFGGKAGSEKGDNPKRNKVANGGPTNQVNPQDLAGNAGGISERIDGNGTGDGSGEKRKGGWPKGKARSAGPAGGPGKIREKVDITKVDISGVEKVLLSIHSHLATLSATPELELEQEEAAKLARAGLDVYKHYATFFPSVTEKTVDLGAAVYALWSIYGTRVMAINLRKRMEQEEAKARAKAAINPRSGPVTPPGFNPPAGLSVVTQ